MLFNFPCGICGKERMRRKCEAGKKLCRSCDLANRGGERNGRWKGGITRQSAKKTSTKEFKAFRAAVLLRDEGKCVLCKSDQKLHVDHIKPRIDFPELLCDVSNGRTLCYECHRKTSTYLSNVLRGRKIPYKKEYKTHCHLGHKKVMSEKEGKPICLTCRKVNNAAWYKAHPGYKKSKKALEILGG